MTDRQNAYVRLTIQKLLFDVEFGKDTDDEDSSNSKRKKFK